MIVPDGDRLRLSGDLTLTTVSGLLEAGRAAVAAGDCVADLSAVTRVDSAALALLFAWLRAARSAGHRLSLVNAPTALVSLASLYDVDGLLPPAA